MLAYYHKNSLVSFGFVAAPDLEKDLKNKHINVESGSRRFKFYQRMMVNLFGPETFYQASDTTNTIYLMINMRQLSTGAVSINDIVERLNQLYVGEYEINI